jgi:hypothetical protein
MRSDIGKTYPYGAMRLRVTNLDCCLDAAACGSRYSCLVACANGQIEQDRIDHCPCFPYSTWPSIVLVLLLCDPTTKGGFPDSAC